MARVMAVAFERHGQLHYLDPGDGQYRVGQWVRYPTEDGVEVAQVVWAAEEVPEDLGAIPVCRGAASDADLRRDKANRAFRAEAADVARGLIATHGLPMKVVGVDYVDSLPDVDRLVAVYYTAPHRVDFRALLRDLARGLNARIDLRQVGSRDAARLIGGIGSCGRELCCTTFLVDFEPVSLRLARVQGLPPNPLQIAGACGKLMCCLAFEHPLYVDFHRRAPGIGERVTVGDEEGVVTGHSVPSDAVTVKVGSGEVVKCPLHSVCSTARAREARVASEGY